VVNGACRLILGPITRQERTIAAAQSRTEPLVSWCKYPSRSNALDNLELAPDLVAALAVAQFERPIPVLLARPKLLACPRVLHQIQLGLDLGDALELDLLVLQESIK
jgi:hypothetical protein